MRGIFRSWPWHAIACLVLLTGAHGQDNISDRLKRETERIATELASGPRLELPPLPPEEAAKAPPEIVVAAGDEFVKAWNAWRIVTFQPVLYGPPLPVKEPKDVVNAYENGALFYDLLERTITATPPPKPSDYSRFTYKSLDWCADGGMQFMRLFRQGYSLALLRNGEHFAAIQSLSRESKGPALDHLLQSFGLDPQEARIGGWLHKRYGADDLCQAGGEKTAVLLLKWTEHRWDIEIGHRKQLLTTTNRDEPFFPHRDLILLLRPNNGVTDETKTRIARFIETRGLEMQPLDQWISSTPRGAEKWLVPLARLGLEHELNHVRTRSSRLLKAAGIEHPAPALRPPVRFRITVNGKPWPGDVKLSGHQAEAPHMSFDFGKGGQAGSILKPLGEGNFEADPDRFFEYPDFRNLEFSTLPSSLSFVRPTSTLAPWLKATISHSLKFDDINEVNIETLEVTIRPDFPKNHTSKAVTEIEFDRVYDPDRPSDGSLYRYHIKDAGEIVLAHVSPGEYWLRVRHPGTALMPMTKVTVGKNHRLLVPKLEFGASVVVPIIWPEGKRPEKLPMDLARTLAWAGNEHSGLSQLLELRRDGKRFVSGPVPISAEGRFPESAIFANLPPGDYEILVPAQTWKAEDGEPAYSVRQKSVKVTVGEDSPEFITAPSLLIDLTSP